MGSSSAPSSTLNFIQKTSTLVLFICVLGFPIRFFKKSYEKKRMQEPESNSILCKEKSVLEPEKHSRAYLATVWSVQLVWCEAVITGYPGGQWLPPCCPALLRRSKACGRCRPAQNSHRQNEELHSCYASCTEFRDNLSVNSVFRSGFSVCRRPSWPYHKKYS